MPLADLESQDGRANRSKNRDGVRVAGVVWVDQCCTRNSRAVVSSSRRTWSSVTHWPGCALWLTIACAGDFVFQPSRISTGI